MTSAYTILGLKFKKGYFLQCVNDYWDFGVKNRAFLEFFKGAEDVTCNTLSYKSL